MMNGSVQNEFQHISATMKIAANVAWQHWNSSPTCNGTFQCSYSHVSWQTACHAVIFCCYTLSLLLYLYMWTSTSKCAHMRNEAPLHTSTGQALIQYVAKHNLREGSGLGWHAHIQAKHCSKDVQGNSSILADFLPCMNCLQSDR